MGFYRDGNEKLTIQREPIIFPRREITLHTPKHSYFKFYRALIAIYDSFLMIYK